MKRSGRPIWKGGIEVAALRSLVRLGLILVTLAAVCGVWAGVAAAQIAQDRLPGRWVSEDERFVFEFRDDNTYTLSGPLGVDLPEISGRYVIPRSGTQLVIRSDELGAAFRLPFGTPTEDLPLALDSTELFGGPTLFGQPFALWPFIGTTPILLIVMTGILFGGAAFLTGQAVANGWGRLWLCVPYGALLTVGDRFLEYALFNQNLLAIPAFAIDLVYLVAVAAMAHRMTTVHKMVSQYPWLYEAAGAFAWRSKAVAAR